MQGVLQLQNLELPVMRQLRSLLRNICSICLQVSSYHLTSAAYWNVVAWCRTQVSLWVYCLDGVAREVQHVGMWCDGDKVLEWSINLSFLWKDAIKLIEVAWSRVSDYSAAAWPSTSAACSSMNSKKCKASYVGIWVASAWTISDVSVEAFCGCPMTTTQRSHTQYL